MRSPYYSNSGYEADAEYFDLIALQESDPSDRKEYKLVAKAYRGLAKSEVTVGTRQEHWRTRALQCRTMVGQFPSVACRTQLERLAQAYEMLAAAEG